MYSFYVHRSQKCKKILMTWLYFFTLLGSTHAKAASRMLVKLTHGLVIPWNRWTIIPPVHTISTIFFGSLGPTFDKTQHVTFPQTLFFELSLIIIANFLKFLQVKNRVYKWNILKNYCTNFLTMKATILDTHSIWTITVS